MLTLVIPTRNRSSFLRRALQYYADRACPYPVIVGDSSTGESLAETQGFLKEISSRLNLEHIVDPQPVKGPSRGWQRDPFLRDLLHAVKTPYAAFFADDDFAVIPNFKYAVDFLESNRDYSFVCGEGFLFNLNPGRVHGKMAAVRKYGLRSVAEDTAAGRLTALMSHYVVLEYGVSRTEQMKIRWKKVFDSGLDNLGGELLNCCLVAIQGKAEKMDRLWLIRQGHAGQSSRAEAGSRGGFENHFFPKMKEILAEELTRADPALSREEAAPIIQTALQNYVQRQDYPGPLNLLRRAYAFLAGKEITLRDLLNSSSPYHADFMPIYSAVKKC